MSGRLRWFGCKDDADWSSDTWTLNRLACHVSQRTAQSSDVP